MPDVVSHWSMGDLVVEKLPNNVRAKIERNAFHLGLLGPDIFSYYYFFLPFIGKRARHRAKVMHIQKTGDFLFELTKQARNSNEFSYLAGFLCHYSLDALSHPFIIETADNRRFMHMAIEHAIDKRILQSKGMDCSEISRMFPKNQSFCNGDRTISSVYGWSNHEYLKSYNHMKLWYRIIIDRKGIIYSIIKYINSNLACILYSSDFYNEIDYESYRELEEMAAAEAVQLIQAAYEFHRNRMTESKYRTVLGNHSYYCKK